MAKDKKVESITDMDKDFAQWFTDVCTKAELVDYSGVKGLFILRPYGYAIWENIQAYLDKRFKETGHTNVSMPMLIPESLLQKEKDHVAGFAPECAWVTVGGSEELPERLCIRPTSETLFCEHWSHIVHSWRDLPCLYNQWCSVLRWEKTTRPFLRGREFLWQEGHTIHATAEEAIAETEQMLEIYADTAEHTYTVECMMHDRKALQSGTSHYFGDGFAKAFGIAFSDKENKLRAPYETSWGMSTRVIGGLIMTHGDNNGLVLPPRVAPIQVIVLPIAAHKPGVTEAAEAVVARLRAAGIRVKGDFSDNSPGWKFAEWEMKGVPVRLELGPRDIENGQCVCARRDSGEKVTLPLENLEESIPALLEAVQQGLFDKAKRNLDEHTYTASTVDEVKDVIENRGGGFVETMWCGDEACELKMKELAGVTSRCIPFDQKHVGDVCPVCGKPARKMIVWGVAY